MRLYADHNATSPLRPEAREAMLRALERGGNPSSVHAEGRRAKAMLEDAREELAVVLEVRAEAVTFTSGATEALHLAMHSARAMGFGPVFVSAAEHDAVWAQAGRLWPDFETISVGPDVTPDLEALEARLSEVVGKPLVIAQVANNETGAVSPVGRLSHLARRAGGALLCDGVQAFGKLPVSAVAGYADWMVVSSHKIGGPQGAGALVTAPGVEVRSDRSGGGQERGARPGTENLPAISGFAAAAGVACSDDAVALFQALTGAERDAFEAALRAEAPDDIVILSEQAPRLSNTTCVALPGREAARQVMALDLAGAAVSAGSACSSGKVKASRVLGAAGWPPHVAGCAIRASFGWSSGPGDGARLAERYLKVAAQLAHRTVEKV